MILYNARTEQIFAQYIQRMYYPFSPVDDIGT